MRTERSVVVEVLTALLILTLFTALTVWALNRVDASLDNPRPPANIPVPSPATTTPDTRPTPTLQALVPAPTLPERDGAATSPPRVQPHHADEIPNISTAPAPSPAVATGEGAQREASPPTPPATLGAAEATAPAQREEIPRQRHWSALEGCDLANYLLDGARAEGKLSDNFYWILPLESSCRNHVVSSSGCCSGLLQIHRLFFNDDRLRELGVGHIVDEMEACGANDIDDIRQRDAWSWQVNICAAHVVYSERLRIYPNEPGECAWDPYWFRNRSACRSRG